MSGEQTLLQRGQQNGRFEIARLDGRELAVVDLVVRNYRWVFCGKEARGRKKLEPRIGFGKGEHDLVCIKNSQKRRAERGSGREEERGWEQFGACVTADVQGRT